MKVHIKGHFIYLAIIIMILSACGQDHNTNPGYFNWDAQYHQFDIKSLDFEDRYFYWNPPISLELNFLHDSDSIRITLVGDQYVYHPYTLASMGLQYINGYYITQDSAYLVFCRKYIDKLSEIGARYHGGIYFPYTFDYGLHNGATDDVMMSPWYSGIAEGYTLSFLSKYFEITGDNSVIPFADSIFSTFLNTDLSSEIWTCMIDTAGYYWVEEYPYTPQTHVLGGFTSGIIGLYNYYLIRGDSRCAVVLNSSLTTIENYFHEFRNPGNISYYCLLHKGQIGHYHLLNISRLRYLALISDDMIFDEYADSLEADYSGGVLLNKFDHEIMDFISD